MQHRSTYKRLRHQGITPEACRAIEQERELHYRRTGVLKPRYEIISEIIMTALGKGGEGV